jgi:SCY1-like protein 2
VLDSNVNTSADLFSLGLLVVSLYNSPHVSPLTTHGSVSTYQRLFDASSTTPSESNTWLCSRPLPRDLQSTVLPRLLTRRPAQRLNAREFQQSQYFDNILVSTIRFLDSLPAKTPQERAQFMRGLPRILAQFPKAVLEKKVLPALTEEMKDRDHLALILQNVFKIIEMLPSRRRAFTERVIPKLRETFLGTSSHIGPKNTAQERDLGKEAGLMVVLERMDLIVDNCSSKDFKDGEHEYRSMRIRS